MAPTAYLRLKGQKSGPIKGGVTLKGREDTIAAIAVSHTIDSPCDAASGLPTGKRLAPYEEVAFTYEKIQWTWNDGGITAEDDWEARA